MQPTVTIDLEEYNNLLKIRNACEQKDYAVSFLALGGKVIILHPTQVERMASYEVVKFSCQLMEAEKKIEELQDKLSVAKKWYQFWK